ncbi:protocadherin alpha-5-like [Eucyclogobius newberryi]|uniref:protocadherin alpha-5-like n=1 Tax=Eucyclogobius newberryi TaxID=166745 RepID=UPI003B5B7303
MAELEQRTHLWTLCFTLLCLWKGSSAQISYSILEESEKGTVVGNITKDLKFNLQQLETTGLRITSAQDKQYLDINRKSGIIFVNERIDREELCPDVVKCVLNMEAIVDDPHGLHRIEVVLLDINDNYPKFKQDIYTIEMYESSYVGEKHPLPAARDADEGSNSVRKYTLSPNEYFSLDVQDAGDHSVTAELVLQKTLDREKQSVIDLTLSAIDGAKPAKTGTVQLKVNVLDVNDNSPLFSKSLYKAQVVENAVMGTALLTLTATDLDEGVNGQLVYSFAKTELLNPNEIFMINSNTGEITVKGNIDYEAKQAYEIRVQVRDKGVPPRLAHGKVLVEVIDINDNAPDVSVSSIMSLVKEDAKIGTAVAMITITDRDGGKNGLIDCKIVGIAPFKLNRNYKNYYSLLVDGPLDRETVSEYNISITAADEGTPSLSSASVIHVKVADVNDNAPHFQEPVINIYVKENSQIGSIIYTLTSSDLDSTENAKLSYSLLTSDKNNVPMSSVVNVNSDTGEIVTLQTFNFEELKTFQFKVQATDSGVPPLSSNVTVNVFILDENDNSPTILVPYSEHGSVNSESIPYSAEAGYFVAKIRAVDADSGYNALLSYHLSEPKGNNLFRIGTSTGEIRTKRRMSDNDLKTHPLVVLVCDNGEPSLSASVTIDVVVVESTADIQTQFRHVPIKEDSFSDLNLYLLIAIVAVSVIFLLSLITLIAVRCHRTESSLSRYSAPMITTHPDGSWSYSKSTQQYDVCFSSDTLKSDVVVFPAPFPPIDAELISINGGDTFSRTQTLPNTDKVNKGTVIGNIVKDLNLNLEDLNTKDLRIVSTYKDAELGTIVALIRVRDRDGGNNGVTHCKVMGSVPFKLTSNYKNDYSLVVDGPLDREDTPEYNVSITASDEGSPPLSSIRVITVHVSDVNDNAPRFTAPVINVYVKENSATGSVLCSVKAIDVDMENNAKLSYTLFGSNHYTNIPTTAAVNINSDTGEIVTLQTFNFEELKTFQFKVQATDAGVPPLSSNVTVNVFILDENDNSPTILAPYSEHGSVNSESIPYSAEAGYFVAKIRAVDADSGYNALLSYHLSEPKGNNLFRIGTNTGEIRTKRRMSDNDLKTHPLVVLVCDNGEPSLSASVTIDVVVVESTADIQTQFRHVPIKEDSFSDLNLYLLIAIVAVSVIFLLSLITLIAVRCHRTESSLSRYSAPMITTHPDGSWSYSKSTQQYDVCFSSDTLKSDVVVLPAPFPPVDAELISINGGDTFTRTQTLPSTDKRTDGVVRESENIGKEKSIFF